MFRSIKNRRKPTDVNRRRLGLVALTLALACVWGLSAAVSTERASQPLTAATLQEQGPCVQAELRSALANRLDKPLLHSDLVQVQELCMRSDIARDQLLVLVHETSTAQAGR